MVTLGQVTQALNRAEHTYGVVHYPNDVQLVVSEYGGRLYGPFVGDEPLCWINPALADPAAYQQFVEAGDWNLGGERIWIAPEIQYNIADRDDFWGTHNVPPQMDPGTCSLTNMDGDTWGVVQKMTLTAHNLASGEVELDMRRVVSPIANPLRGVERYQVLMEDVLFAGYQQEITLADQKESSIMSETWNLVQLNPGGRLFIPVTSTAAATPYFGDVPAEAKNAVDKRVRIHITGQRQFKVGYKAVYLTGRMGYLNTLDDGRAYLLVRSFFNDPSAFYCEEPPDEPGNSGHAVHVYNDGGDLGGFGEMECNGRTIGGETGRYNSTDVFTMWAFVGAQEKIHAIAKVLLGVSP